MIKNTTNAKSGMVLAFTLVLLILISLMGVYVLTNTATELSISGHNRVGREAFNAADSSAMLATLLGRLVLHPELGDPANVLKVSNKPALPMTVEINQSRFNLASLQAESLNFDFNKRYQEAVNFDHSSSVKPPHLVFKVRDKVVATAVVSLDSDVPIGAGFSLSSGDSYDNAGGAGIQINLVITTNGSPSTNAQGTNDEPHSVVTTIYREYM
ncbi:MAG: pilus assembly PilX N-terminal domain-containing protein [Deltaproteobacteria bacterium]|jgi:hypothetical protein|nr:pilus assembly PilX N-terminal domain-containing protein [Deltaproteobacteria bacterium]